MSIQELAARIVDELLANLQDRKGFDDLWDSMDVETRDEMRLTWQDITAQILSETSITAGVATNPHA